MSVYKDTGYWIIQRAPFDDDTAPEGMVLHFENAEWRWYRTARPGELD